jgi:hypothetical protein
MYVCMYVDISFLAAPSLPSFWPILRRSAQGQPAYMYICMYVCM